MKTTEIIRVNSSPGSSLSFDFDGSNILINGTLLKYTDGSFNVEEILGRQWFLSGINKQSHWIVNNRFCCTNDGKSSPITTLSLWVLIIYSDFASMPKPAYSLHMDVVRCPHKSALRVQIYNQAGLRQQLLNAISTIILPQKNAKSYCWFFCLPDIRAANWLFLVNIYKI